MPNKNQADKLSDEEIVKLTLENQDYFLHIINRYKIKLFYFIRRITNVRDEDAEDLMQEIFLKIYMNLNDFDDDMKFSTWAYAIARNHTISNHRKLNARAEGHAVTLDDAHAEQLIADFDIERNVDRRLAKDEIAQVLDKLDKKYREVLILKFLEEKNYQEISDIIKRPTGTVGSMLNKARELFKKEMEKQKLKK